MSKLMSIQKSIMEIQRIRDNALAESVNGKPLDKPLLEDLNNREKNLTAMLHEF